LSKIWKNKMTIKQQKKEHLFNYIIFEFKKIVFYTK
jgi:hypothetical protein